MGRRRGGGDRYHFNNKGKFKGFSTGSVGGAIGGAAGAGCGDFLFKGFIGILIIVAIYYATR